MLICVLLAGVAAVGAARADVNVAAGAFLASAVKEARKGDWEQARRFAGHARDEVARDLLEWMWLREGLGEWEDYVAFLHRHPDWPGLRLLRTRGEAKIPQALPVHAVIEYFGDQSPRSGIGSLRLVEALQREGRSAEARREIIRAWTHLSLTADEQAVFLKRHGEILAPHHPGRADMLLWRGLTRQAERMMPLLGPEDQALVRARIALRRRTRGVDDLVRAVPESRQDDPGLAYERFLWRTRKGLTDTAEELLRERSVSAESLGRPDKWANRRRALARQAMRDGDGPRAYEIASRHFLTQGSDYADLEWLSGYIALRLLNDPKTATLHFANFSRAVSSPISRGRAGYWLGRALEAAGFSEEALIAYRDGARYQTSFYGQLSAERAGVPIDPALVSPDPVRALPPEVIERDSVLHAALLWNLADEPALARRFFVHMAATQDAQGLHGLADFALSLGRPNIALMIAKQAARRGIILPRAYFPVTDLAGMDVAVPPEIALAIARRESEFNPDAISPAGARGLMQLMPRTARRMSEQMNLSYSPVRLTDDWKYNARLGSQYLAQLLKDYEGSYILTFAAYNAGPSRVAQWIETYGDPRAEDVDDIDWIEHIPFRETRNYVMRVMEAVFVYRARLRGLSGVVQVTRAEPL